MIPFFVALVAAYPCSDLLDEFDAYRPGDIHLACYQCMLGSEQWPNVTSMHPEGLSQCVFCERPGDDSSCVPRATASTECADGNIVLGASDCADFTYPTDEDVYCFDRTGSGCDWCLGGEKRCVFWTAPPTQAVPLPRSLCYPNTQTHTALKILHLESSDDAIREDSKYFCDDDDCTDYEECSACAVNDACHWCGAGVLPTGYGSGTVTPFCFSPGKPSPIDSCTGGKYASVAACDAQWPPSTLPTPVPSSAPTDDTSSPSNATDTTAADDDNDYFLYGGIAGGALLLCLCCCAAIGAAFYCFCRAQPQRNDRRSRRGSIVNWSGQASRRSRGDTNRRSRVDTVPTYNPILPSPPPTAFICAACNNAYPTALDLQIHREKRGHFY